jgi:hypothetical protein
VPHLQGLRAREEVIEYTNSSVARIIDEYIHSERDRAIIKRRLIDGVSIERLAEEFDRSPRAMQRKVAKLQEAVFLHLR